MTSETIGCAVSEQVLTIMNRLGKLNVFSPTLHIELRDAIDRADSGDDIRAMVVTGAGRALGADVSLGEDMFYAQTRLVPHSSCKIAFGNRNDGEARAPKGSMH